MQAIKQQQNATPGSVYQQHIRDQHDGFTKHSSMKEQRNHENHLKRLEKSGVSPGEIKQYTEEYEFKTMRTKTSQPYSNNNTRF